MWPAKVETKHPSDQKPSQHKLLQRQNPQHIDNHIQAQPIPSKQLRQVREACVHESNSSRLCNQY